MSPDRLSSQDGSNKIIAQMSLDRNHIILQQQQQYTTGNIILNKNGILSLDSAAAQSALNNNNINMINHNTNAFNGLLTTTSAPTMASKYVVLSDMMTENYIKSMLIFWGAALFQTFSDGLIKIDLESSFNVP